MKALFEVVILPVSDPDRSLRFYRDQVGFDLDVDYAPAPDFRVIQLTPQGSRTSIQFGLGLTDAPAGSAQGLYLVVTDIEDGRRELTDRGVAVGEIRHKDTDGGWCGGFLAGPDPDRADYASFADFRDPDGNAWVLQERGHSQTRTRRAGVGVTSADSPGAVDNGMMSAAPNVLVFDVNETLLDIESMAPLFERIFGDPRVLREWFGQLVMYSMTATLSGHYVDFFTLGQGLLRMLADIHRVDVTEEDVHRVKEGMLTMPAHPDARDGLNALRDHGFRLVTLTNSPPSPNGPSPLEHAGLGGFFEQQFSVDAVQTAKPAPQVYRYVCHELDVAPAECMMVTAHVWDTIGAQSVGFSAALIVRHRNALLPVEGLPQPALVAADLRQLAHQLCRS